MAAPSPNPPPAKPANQSRGPENTFDFPSLILDHPVASKHTFTLVDLDVNIYGLDEIAGSTLPVAVVMLSHGRCNNAMNMEPMASGLLGEFSRLEKATGKKRTKDVLVATLDQRNHGKRTRFRNTNLAFDVNKNHLVDMMTTIYGGMQDQQLLIEFLPAYLFPHGERTIVEFMPVGVSMGGHTVWRLLNADPRITIGVPIISLPAEVLGAHFIQRAKDLGVASGELIYPPTVEKWCTLELGQNQYKGKKILSIHGVKDPVLPPSRAFPVLAQIAAQNKPGEVDMYADEAAGHKCSEPMVERAAEWLWRWGLSDEGAATTKAKL